jgi:hypothetical protein
VVKSCPDATPPPFVLLSYTSKFCRVPRKSARQKGGSLWGCAHAPFGIAESSNTAQTKEACPTAEALVADVVSVTTIGNRFVIVNVANFSTASHAQDATRHIESLTERNLAAGLGASSDTRGGTDESQAGIWESLAAVPTNGDDGARKRLDHTIHAELYPVVGQILNGWHSEPSWSGRGNGSGVRHAAPFTGTAPYRLRAGLLQTDYLVPLNNSACRRLELVAPTSAAARAVRVGLCDVRLYLLGTGIGLLTFEFCVSGAFRGSGHEAPAELISETLTALCAADDRAPKLQATKFETKQVQETLSAGSSVVRQRDEKFGWFSTREAEAQAAGVLLESAGIGASATAAFGHGQGAHTIGGLCDAVLGGANNGAISTRNDGAEHRRLFAYCGVLLPRGTDEATASLLAYRYAHRYSADYECRADAIDAAQTRPFRNVTHAMATQGGAVVVVDGQSTFVTSFLDQPLKMTYVPLALVAFHEYTCLRLMTPRGAHPSPGDGVGAHEAALIGLQESLAYFRLHYRFSHVSDLANHNQVFAQWRKVLDLDSSLEQRSQDAAEGERVLVAGRKRNEAAAANRAERDRLFFKILACFGAIPFVNNVKDMVVGALFHPATTVSESLLALSIALRQGKSNAEMLRKVEERTQRVHTMLEDLQAWDDRFLVLSIVISGIAVVYVLRHKKSVIGSE